MAMKFDDTFRSLKAMLDTHGIVGSWHKEPNGVHLLRTPEAANLHWASGSKSLWIDGRDGARQKLERRVAGLLAERFTE